MAPRRHAIVTFPAVRRSWSQKWGALEERPFRLLWLAQTSSALGDALIPVALAFAVLQALDASASDLGFVLAAFALSRVAFTLVGGVWADRLQRRRVMLVCDAIRAAVEFFTFGMLLAGAMELWMFAATAALFGAASAFFGPAATGLIPETASRERLQQANALIAISRSATSIGGPAISGALVAAAGPAWVFAIDGGSFVVSAAFLLALHPSGRVPPPRQRFFTDLALGLREVTARTWLWAGLIVAAIANLGNASFYVLGPVIFEDEFRGAADWGLVLTAGATGGLLGGTAGLRWKPGRPLVAAFILYSGGALALAALAVPLRVPLIAAATAAYFGGIAAANIVWETTLQSAIPDEVLSRVSSYDWLVSLVFTPLGFTVAGPAAESLGRGTTLWIAASLTAGSTLLILTLPSVRQVRAKAPLGADGPITRHNREDDK
jgi:MFS family permease